MNECVDPVDLSSEPASELSERTIRNRLILWLWNRKAVFIPNVFVNQWESDLIKITPAGYWTEYEIKTTLSDYRADFAKSVSRYRTDAKTKHLVYSQAAPASWGTQPIPKPKHFFFVLPRNLLTDIDVPSYCGIISYFTVNNLYLFRSERKPTVLRNHTKLTTPEIFILLSKLSLRLATSS